MRMIGRVWIVACAVVASIVMLTPGWTAGAHPMPHTVVLLDVQDQHISAEFRLPLDDLALASSIDLRQQDPLRSVDSTRRQLLANYLEDHTDIRSIDGRAWHVGIGNATIAGSDDPEAGPYDEVVVDAVLTPPGGVDVRRFIFGYDGIVGEVATHEALVSVRQDFGAGQVDSEGQRRLLGTVRTDSETMTVPAIRVDLDGANAWAGFTGMFTLGVHHILAGTDHLLFLFSLLLLAPLIAAGGRWQPQDGFRPALRRTAAITAAFTAGHSVALVVSATTRIAFPERFVEFLIAASIFVTALHAIRPIFPGREVLIAAGFGLIHGMAFAFTLADLQLSSGQLVLALLGFNLGIEAAQILLVLLALPPLLLISATRWQATVRVAIAIAATVAALGWALERAGMDNAIATAADQLSNITALGLVIFAAAVTVPSALQLWRRGRSTPNDSAPNPARFAPEGSPTGGGVLTDRRSGQH